MKLGVAIAILVTIVIVTLVALRIASGWRLQPYWEPSGGSSQSVVESVP